MSVQYPTYTEELSQQDFLEYSGVLDLGTEAIKKAKKEYRKQYQAYYQKKRRKTFKLINIELDENERNHLAKKSQEYELTVTAYIKHRLFASTKTYSPRVSVSEILQVLSITKQVLNLMVKRNGDLIISAMSVKAIESINQLTQRLKQDDS